MSNINAEIQYGVFLATEPVAHIVVTLTEVGGAAPLTQTIAPDTVSVVFADVPAGQWSATYQAVGATGPIGPAYTTNSVIVPTTMNVNVPVGGSISLA